MMALENMLTDKVAFCGAHGISIRPEEWPSHHIPKVLVSDRGEFFSKAGEQLIRHLHINRDTAPPYRGDFKPYVERFFGRVRNDVRQLPGGLQDQDRGERDYRLSAVLDLDDFTRILILLVLEYNNTVISRTFEVPADMTADVLLTPAAVWQWGVVHRRGLLRTASLMQYRYAILPHRSASITREGVLADTLRFTADWAVERQWFAKAALAEPEKIEVAYDPRTVDGLWWQDGDGTVRELVLRPDDRRAVGGLTWEEAAAWRSVMAGRRAVTRNDTQQVIATREAQIRSISQKAQKRAKGASTGESPRARLIDMRANRQAERDERRVADRWITPPEPPPLAAWSPGDSNALDRLMADMEDTIPGGDGSDA